MASVVITLVFDVVHAMIFVKVQKDEAEAHERNDDGCIEECHDHFGVGGRDVQVGHDLHCKLCVDVKSEVVLRLWVSSHVNWNQNEREK